MQKLVIKEVLNLPAEKPRGAVIWLHGLGADYNDFVPIVAELKLTIPLKFVFPNAPLIPVTINNGLPMRAWYDILDFNDLHREVDSNGMMHSVEQIKHLISDLQHEGFSPEQIVIAGFSQGGAISYYTALTSEYNLAGLLVLSAYLPDYTLLDGARLQQLKQLAIMVCHGSQDEVVSPALAHQAMEYLQQFGLQLKWHEYPMAHNVCYEEVVAIAAWLTQIFS